jgi:hypothetical protein
MMYILIRTDGAYVSRHGSEHSYTRRLEHARTYTTREAAQRDACVENERVEELTELMKGNRA